MAVEGGDVQVDPVGAGGSDVSRQFHRDEHVSAASQRASGLEGGSRYIGERVQELGVRLILQRLMGGPDDAERFGFAGEWVRADRGKAGCVDGRDTVITQNAGRQRHLAYVPAPEMSQVHGLLGCERITGDGGAATVRDIARRVGVTVPALYYHHENKEAMLVALLNVSMDDLLRWCEEALIVAGSVPDSRFLNLVGCLVLFMLSRRGLVEVGTEIRVLGEAERASYVAKRNRIEEMLLDAIEEGIEAKRLRCREAERSDALLSSARSKASQPGIREKATLARR